MPVAKGVKLKCGRCNKLKNKKSKDPCNCGRPSKKTPELEKKLELLFKQGLKIGEACLQAGITEKSLQKRTKEDEEFSRKMENAKNYPNMIAKYVLLNEIEGNKNWKAALARLEKRDPDFKKTQKLDVDVASSVVYLPIIEGEIIEPEALEEKEQDE